MEYLRPDSLLYLLMLAGVVVYVVKRHTFRFTVCVLVLSSFLILYGLGYFLYYDEIGWDSPTVPKLTFALLLMWPCMILGMELANFIFKKSSDQARQFLLRWNEIQLQPSFPRKSVIWLVLPTVFALVFVIAVSEGELGKVFGYYGSMEGDTDSRLQFRMAYGASSLYLVNLLNASVLPFFSLILVGRALIIRTVDSRLAAAASVAVVLLMKLGTLQKAPAAVFLIQVALVYILAKRNTIRLPEAVALVALFLSTIVPLTVSANPDFEIDEFLDFFLYRTLTVSMEVIENYFIFFPDVYPHTWGKGIRLIGQFASEPYVSTPVIIAAELGAEGGSFNAMFIADAWSEFATYGLIVVPIIAGFALRGFDIYALSRGKTVESIALQSASLWGVVMIAQTSLTAALLTGGLLLLPVTSFLVSKRLAGMDRAWRPPDLKAGSSK